MSRRAIELISAAALVAAVIVVLVLLFRAVM